MNFVRSIPFRYLFGRKSSNAIHWITGISILGISIGTASLILVLSIFNGFEELLSTFFSKHNPDIKIVLKEGKFFEEDSTKIAKLKSLPQVKNLTRTLEENALFNYLEAQDFGTIMGVDSAYNTVCSFNEAIMESSDMNCSQMQCATIGIGVRNKLGIDLSNPLEEIRIFIPTLEQINESTVNVNSLRSLYLKPSKVFSIHQEQDYEFVLTDLELLRQYIGKNKLLSSIELKLNETHNSTIVHELQTIMGNDFQVKDRSKQDESFIKIMKLEKWLFFALFSLTLVIVCFTLIGTIWMIVLEKKMDISILKSLGMQESDVKSIFIRLGLLLTLIGIALGFILALIFYWMQKQYGIVGVPEEFIIDSYPISISIWDFLIVFITVFSIGFIASILPAQKIQSIPTIFREE